LSTIETIFTPEFGAWRSEVRKSLPGIFRWRTIEAQLIPVDSTPKITLIELGVRPTIIENKLVTAHLEYN